MTRGGAYVAAMRALESIVGWRTERRVRGKLLVGNVEGVAAGLRIQRRKAPLESPVVRRPAGSILSDAAIWN
jgi:hypothetical protein